jgi:hypothetical protein
LWNLDFESIDSSTIQNPKSKIFRVLLRILLKNELIVRPEFPGLPKIRVDPLL